MENKLMPRGAFIDRLAEGILPEEFDDLSAGMTELIRISSVTNQALAVVIAEARERIDIRTWIDWCDEKFGLDKICYRSHLLKIGRMLNILRKDEKTLRFYKKLFFCSIDKLLAVARIPENELPAFLGDHPGICDMKRDQVRAAVAAWLHEEPAPGREQPNLPGFDDALDAIVQIDPQKLVCSVTDPERARRSLIAGMGLLGAAAEYHKSAEHPDIELLAQARTALIDEAGQLEKIIAAHATPEGV